MHPAEAGAILTPWRLIALCPHGTVEDTALGQRVFCSLLRKTPQLIQTLTELETTWGKPLGSNGNCPYWGDDASCKLLVHLGKTGPAAR